MSLPTETKSIVLTPSPPDRNPRYHNATLLTRPIPELKERHVLVKMAAAAFNHRDVWIRKGLYPNIIMGHPMGADGAGTVIASGDPNDPLLNKRVFLVPHRGWHNDPDSPEADLAIIGGTLPSSPIGTFSEYAVVERDQVIPSPEHLDDVQTAAWPLGGVTAWRATMVKGRVAAGKNVLITGIGGGVAILALQLCVAKGANVYVTSSNEEKIRKAIDLGAKGGANYKDATWPSHISSLLSKNATGNPKSALLDVIIDSAGGDIITRTGKILRHGGSIVCYGMTVEPKVTFTMREVLKNQQLLGSTMGSYQDLLDATAFLSAHRIVPVVSHILDGLERAEEGFELLHTGNHFGKVVITIRDSIVNPVQQKL